MKCFIINLCLNVLFYIDWDGEILEGVRKLL